MGKTEPPPPFSLWVYPVNNTVAILRARDTNGQWIDIVGGGGGDSSDTQLYVATLGFEYEMNEDGWYSVTESLKHNEVEIGAGDILDAYESGKTVILIANGRDIFQLTSAYPVDDTALVELSRTNNSEHWTIEVYGNGAWVKSHTGSMEDVNHKVWETDVAGVEQYEESFEKYPSMMSMIGYVTDKVNSIKPYIVTLGFDHEINPETGGYYITDPPKHNRRQVTSNDIYEAYQAGRTVILIANDAIVCPLTDRIFIDTDFYGVRFTGFYDGDYKLDIEIIDTSCRVTDATVEDERNKVGAWELDEEQGGNLEDAFKDGRYPSMGAMVKYVEDVTNDIKSYIVTLDYDFETLEVTDPLKHEGIAIGSGDITDAYSSGKTVILVANGSEIGQLTYVGEYYVRFLLVDTYNHLEFMVMETSCTITRLINENAENKVNDPESVSEDDYWSGEKYPSMNIMRNYVEGKTGDIETALDNIIAIQNSLMGVSE